MRQGRIVPQFVEYIPERLDDGVLYISRKYATATHKCCCGCGEEVVTPLNPTDWSLALEGSGVTLNPSIGNWSYACRSHYWIRAGCVLWDEPLPQWQIDRIRAHDRAHKEAYFAALNSRRDAANSHLSCGPNAQPAQPPSALFSSIWRAVQQWLG